MRARLRRALRELRRSERGIALPVALLITVVALALASVPIAASVHSQSGDVRGQAANQALAAAESGAELALLAQDEAPCAPPPGREWCGPSQGEVGGNEYRYWVRPAAAGGERLIEVAAAGTGSAGSRAASRRVMVTAGSAGGAPVVFGDEAVIGIDWVEMQGSARIQGNAGSNGDIIWDGDPTIECDHVRVGPSGEFRLNPNWQVVPCPLVHEAPHEYPPPIVPASNSNWRMFTAGGDTYTYSNGALGGCGASRKQSSWCAQSKVLALRGSDAAVTLGGSAAPYVFCKLLVEGDSRLIMAPGAHVQIVFPSPEECESLPYAEGPSTEQMVVANGGQIESPAYAPDQGSYALPGFYFVGSESKATKIAFKGAGQSVQLIMYAPRSDIEILNGASFGGAILGKTVLMSGGTWVEPQGTGIFDPDEQLGGLVPTGGDPSAFARESFVECSAAPTSEADPFSGC